MKDDRSAELRPANYRSSGSDNELADEGEIKLFNRDELARGTNRKSSDNVTQRSSLSHTLRTLYFEIRIFHIF